MPRGNDSEVAAAELADKFGSGTGNAEHLIEANNAERPVELLQAQMKAVDEEATEALDIDKLKGPNGEQVISATVRGGQVIAAWEDETGRAHKGILDDSDKKPSRRGKAKDADADDE